MSREEEAEQDERKTRDDNDNVASSRSRPSLFFSVSLASPSVTLCTELCRLLCREGKRPSETSEDKRRQRQRCLVSLSSFSPSLLFSLPLTLPPSLFYCFSTAPPLPAALSSAYSRFSDATTEKRLTLSAALSLSLSLSVSFLSRRLVSSRALSLPSAAHRLAARGWRSHHCAPFCPPCPLLSPLRARSLPLSLFASRPSSQPREQNAPLRPSAP